VSFFDQSRTDVPIQMLQNFMRYKEDPWAFLCECVFTKDQVDKLMPIKPFPSEWEYLRLYVMIWHKYRLTAVPKSRRMTMSWTHIALYVWDTIFNSVRDQAFVSKKEDDAGELVKRAEFIFDHIPESKIPRRLLPRKETRAKPAALSFPELESKIQGFPMGADQLRQFTFSGILGDECAFWEEAQKFYAASYPTIEGGGRMNLISSRSPGFFQRLVFDALDHEGTIDEENTPPKQYPLGDDSVIIWVNPKNKFLIFDVHYTANPLKRGNFGASVKASMPIKDFMVEYERNWEAFEGKAVYEDYDKLRHEVRREELPHLGLPLLLGWDFGLTPAAVVGQLRGNQLHIIREFVSEHSSIEKFAPAVMSELKVHYPEWRDAKTDFRHYIDPAGLQKVQTDARTCASVMYSKGLRSIYAGPNDWESRRKAVEHFLMLHTRDGAGLQLNPKHCSTLSKGFSGGYVYPEKYLTLEPAGKPTPVKNKYSHPHDALQYLAGGALSLLGHRPPTKEIPVPTYSFTQS
jgi:hypothetical protein